MTYCRPYLAPLGLLRILGLRSSSSPVPRIWSGTDQSCFVHHFENWRDYTRRDQTQRLGAPFRLASSYQ